jgi:diguanylate cyclase (GGDEF)-like protein
LAAEGLQDMSLFVVIDLGTLLQKAQLARLAATGLDYRLTLPGSGRAAVISGGAKELERPVLREITAADTRWLLAVAAPAGPAVPWQTLLMHALIVVALAVAAGLAVEGRAHDSALAQAQLGARTQALQETTRKLAEEIQLREDLEKQFTHASFHDALTGLPTRRFIVNRLEAALRPSRGLAGGGRLAVAILELDRVKAISDSLGLAVGDELLAQAARRLESATAGSEYIVGRLRDAEFACVIQRLTADGEALEVVDRLRHALLEPFTIAGQTLYTGAQAGIAYDSPQLGHPEDLLRGAHIALSHARLERLPFVVFDPTTQEQVISRQQLESDLHGVAERGELLLRYQPIVALASGEIVGFEALVRWQHPVEGMIPPAMFIPLAEETGLIGPITRWVLGQACRDAQAWREELPAGRDFYVSVNLSAHDMRQLDLAEHVERLVAANAIAPGMLRLEVTEGIMIDNPRAAVELMARLRLTGARILLDDFGTGYSSLSYLHRFPIDYLKIDQSFVRRMTPDPKSSGIVRAILYLAEAMGIETVAEGVETAEVMRQLIEMRCGYAQGYHFSKPIDAHAALALLGAGPEGAAVEPPRRATSANML